MAIRTNTRNVKLIVETGLTNLTSFITTASLLVDEELVGTGMSDERLTEIEKYLAAHFVLMLEERGGLLETRSGESEDTYALDVGRGLAQTRYGQQALFLDTSGKLNALSSGRAGRLKTFPRALTKSGC